MFSLLSSRRLCPRGPLSSGADQDVSLPGPKKRGFIGTGILLATILAGCGGITTDGPVGTGGAPGNTPGSGATTGSGTGGSSPENPGSGGEPGGTSCGCETKDAFIYFARNNEEERFELGPRYPVTGNGNSCVSSMPVAVEQSCSADWQIEGCNTNGCVRIAAQTNGTQTQLTWVIDQEEVLQIDGGSLGIYEETQNSVSGGFVFHEPNGDVSTFGTFYACRTAQLDGNCF